MYVQYVPFDFFFQSSIKISVCILGTYILDWTIEALNQYLTLNEKVMFKYHCKNLNIRTSYAICNDIFLNEHKCILLYTSIVYGIKINCKGHNVQVHAKSGVYKLYE